MERAQPAQATVVVSCTTRPTLRVRPYRTTDNKIDGAMIALVDLEGRKDSDAGKSQSARSNLLAQVKSNAERITVKSRHRLGEPRAN